MAREQPRSQFNREPVENVRQVIKEVRVTEITQEYCESLVSSMTRPIQLTLDVIKFQIVVK